jgi:type III secretory pathway component EscS
MVVAAFAVPQGAPLLGLDVTARLWNALRLTAPFLSQVGDVIAGATGGLVVGLLQALSSRSARGRWVRIALLAGAAVGAAHAFYAPLTIVAAPVAGAVAGLFQAPQNPRWPRAQALAAAWVALAAMLPFPRWVAAAFLVGAALISTWGISYSPPSQLPSVR